MSFQKLLDTEQFVIIAQLEPPKGVDTELLSSHADSLRGRIHAAFVPETMGAIMRMGSLGAGSFLKEKGITPIINTNCRDRNRLAIQADVLSASILGLENLFISKGDEISGGDHIDAKPVNDLDEIGLLECLKKLRKGIDLAGNDISGMPEFCAGSEVNAGLKRGALEIEILEMEKKIKAGADYFFTPPIYDMDVLESFMKKTAPFKVPVFPQIMILKSVGMARFMNRHMDGVVIPDELIDRLGKSSDKTKEGITIAAEAVVKLKDISQGALIVAVGGEERLAQVLDQAGN